MKKLTLAIAFCFSFLLALAQPCAKGISTNPSAPVNPEKPSKTNTFFDWRTQFYQVNSAAIAATQIESPFFQNNNANVSHFFENKDMSPADGWELITYDLGFNENGTPRNPPTDYVFLVLYNKHTGILRVFLAGNSPTSFNGAQIQLKFHDVSSLKLSSVLSNVDKLFPLDHFEEKPEQLAITNYPNGLGRWFYADFQMSYDVCTCIYESTLWIQVKLLSTAQVNLRGNITGLVTPVANINQTAGSVTDEGFSVKELIAPVPSGLGRRAQKAFKNANEFTTSIEKTLGINTKTNAQLTAAQLGTRSALDQLKADLSSSGFLKNGLKALPYLASALEIVEFFTGGGKSGSGTNTPMALNANLSLSGTITSAFDYRNIFFYTPGSLNAANKAANRYAYYNEVLGVFNLLTSPKVYFKNPFPFARWDFQLVTPASNGIEYVINPAAGFDLAQSEIMGNLKLRQSTIVLAESGLLPLEALRNFKTFFLSGDIIPNFAQLEIFLNLRRLNAQPNDQNVLIKATYNIELIRNESFTYAAASYNRILRDIVIENQTVSNNRSAWNSVTIKPNTTLLSGTTISTTAGQVASNYSTSVVQPSAARISEFCNSPVYRDHPLRNPANLRSRQLEEETGNQAPIPPNEMPMRLIVYPNPANDYVQLKYYLETESAVKLELRSVTGVLVSTLVNANQEAGPHEIDFDVAGLARGLYICQLQTNRGSSVYKLVISGQ